MLRLKIRAIGSIRKEFKNPGDGTPNIPVARQDFIVVDFSDTISIEVLWVDDPAQLRAAIVVQLKTTLDALAALSERGTFNYNTTTKVLTKIEE